MSVPVSFDELLTAFEWVSAGEVAALDCEAYINRATGTVHWCGEGVDEKPPEDIEDESLYIVGTLIQRGLGPVLTSAIESATVLSNCVSEFGESSTAMSAILKHPNSFACPMSSFQLVGLSPEPFEPLFRLSTEQLAARGAHRVIALSKPGYPCRVSLVDAEVGEELLLLPYEHQPANSPYKASGPIYVRRGAKQRISLVGEVPEYVGLRLMSVRAYDKAHMIVAASVCEGQVVAAEIERLFADREVRYIHLHNAKHGCFSCLAQRAA